MARRRPRGAGNDGSSRTTRRYRRNGATLESPNQAVARADRGNPHKPLTPEATCNAPDAAREWSAPGAPRAPMDQQGIMLTTIGSALLAAAAVFGAATVVEEWRWHLPSSAAALRQAGGALLAGAWVAAWGSRRLRRLHARFGRTAARVPPAVERKAAERQILVAGAALLLTGATWCVVIAVLRWQEELRALLAVRLLAPGPWFAEVAAWPVAVMLGAGISSLGIGAAALRIMLEDAAPRDSEMRRSAFAAALGAGAAGGLLLAGVDARPLPTLTLLPAFAAGAVALLRKPTGARRAAVGDEPLVEYAGGRWLQAPFPLLAGAVIARDLLQHRAPDSMASSVVGIGALAAALGLAVGVQLLRNTRTAPAWIATAIMVVLLLLPGSSSENSPWRAPAAVGLFAAHVVWNRRRSPRNGALSYILLGAALLASGLMAGFTSSASSPPAQFWAAARAEASVSTLWRWTVEQPGRTAVVPVADIGPDNDAAWIDAAGPRFDFVLLEVDPTRDPSRRAAERVLRRARSALRHGGRLGVTLPAAGWLGPMLRADRMEGLHGAWQSFVLRMPREDEALGAAAFVAGPDIPAWLREHFTAGEGVALYPVGSRADLRAILNQIFRAPQP